MLGSSTMNTIERKTNTLAVGQPFDIQKAFVHLVRIALQGNHDDVAALARQYLRRIEPGRADLKAPLAAAMELAQASPVRRQSARPLPVDPESKLELVRCERAVVLRHEPLWPATIENALRLVVKERAREDELRSGGVSPTRSLLFCGPPGVGKTLAAHWLARETNRPIFTLDLASVMNSFLGKTGSNLRTVIDHAKREPSVLLLDEFDALAKRRGDATEVGELKRLVTVLIQELDAWPDHGLLVCATNHAELLDPAVWRRFDAVLDFPKPTASEIAQTLSSQLGLPVKSASTLSLVALLLKDSSFSDVNGLLNRARRSAILDGLDLELALLEQASSLSRSSPITVRNDVARKLLEAGLSQRRVSDLTGLARDTLRKSTSTSRLAAVSKRTKKKRS
jgi:ATPase family associated with various cellular activities (AAA)